MWIDKVLKEIDQEKNTAEQRLMRFIERANSTKPLYSVIYDMALAHAIIYQKLAEKKFSSEDEFKSYLEKLAEEPPKVDNARNKRYFSEAWKTKINSLKKKFS